MADSSVVAPHDVTSKETFLERLRRYPEEAALRLFAILCSLLFFYFFPKLVFITYMGYKGFFSYDFFATGQLGIESFYTMSELLLILASFYVSGVAYKLAKRRASRHPEWLPPYADPVTFTSTDRGALVATLLLNVVVLAIAVFVAAETSKTGANWASFDLDRFLSRILNLSVIFLISSWIMRHLGEVRFMRASRVMTSLVVGALVLVFVCIEMPGTVARLLDPSLQYFGVGGGLPVSIVFFDGVKRCEVDDRLTLLTPTQVFVGDAPLRVRVLDRSKIVELDIQNTSSLHHVMH